MARTSAPPRSTREPEEDDTKIKFVRIFRLETRDLTAALDAVAKLGWMADNDYTPHAAPRGTLAIFRRGKAMAALVQRGAAFSLLDIPKAA